MKKKRELVCLRCGKRCDSIDRVKVFGNPRYLLRHICIDCRDELKQEEQVKYRKRVNAAIEEMKVSDRKRTRVITSSSAAAHKAACDAAEERLIKAEMKDFIGL